MLQLLPGGLPRATCAEWDRWAEVRGRYGQLIYKKFVADKEKFDGCPAGPPEQRLHDVAISADEAIPCANRLEFAFDRRGRQGQAITTCADLHLRWVNESDGRAVDSQCSQQHLPLNDDFAGGFHGGTGPEPVGDPSYLVGWSRGKRAEGVLPASVIAR